MTTTHRITTTAAAILGLAAAGAPTAVATVSPTNPATTASQAPATAVYSRPDKSMVSGTTPATTSDQPAASVYSRPDKSMIPVTTSGSAPQAIVRITTPQSGFDWGDAGIGAAGGLALAMIGLGGALAVTQRRPRGSRQTTPLS